jgi:hypothetical protein
VGRKGWVDEVAYVQSMSRPPMKNDIRAPMKPETESRPRLWIFQWYGATVKVRAEVSWIEIFLFRSVHNIAYT